jgi:hypothetical protein
MSKNKHNDPIPMHQEIHIEYLDVYELRALAKKVQERIDFLLTKDPTKEYIEFHENR